MIDARHFHLTDTLKDGTPVVIRAVCPEDKGRIDDAFHHLDPETIYTRYFRYKNALTEEELKWATELDFEKDVALVVTVLQEAREIVIGGSRFSVLASDPGAPRRAEIAFTVEEDYQGQGIAGRLLRHMTHIAREMGIAAFEAEVLPQNKAMLAVFERGGLTMEKRADDGVIYVTLSLAAQGDP